MDNHNTKNIQTAISPAKVRPWIGIKPKSKKAGTETIRHEFKAGQQLLDFSARGCSTPPERD